MAEGGKDPPDKVPLDDQSELKEELKEEWKLLEEEWKLLKLKDKLDWKLEKWREWRELSKEKLERDVGSKFIQNVKGGRERRFTGRITVIGHLGAGKTTLIDRLLLKEVDMSKSESTNGIVLTQIGAFFNENGEWTPTEKPNETIEVLQRMKGAKSHETQGDNKVGSGVTDEVYSKYLIRKKKLEAHGKSKSTTDQTEDEMGSSRSQKQEGTKCRLYFVDFAGQSVFNSTHQLFMGHRTIYFLTFDISKDLKSIVEDDGVYSLGSNRKLCIEDFIEFLLNSIHVYRDRETESSPKVVFIGTHKDQVTLTTAQKRMKEIKSKFQDTPLQENVCGDFIVDCSIPNDPETDKLRQFMFEILQQESYWGEETPTRWLPLEENIIEKQEGKERVLKLHTIKQMNEECFVKLESDDEIEKFLRFHNDVGSFMFFGETSLDDIIILDPQWLIDSLKQIITHERFYLRLEGLSTAWKDFYQCAKLYKRLIEAVWSNNEDQTFITHKKQLLSILEKTDIIASPLTYNNDGNAEVVDYYFVPSMLKPKQEGSEKIAALLGPFSTKSPALCFVFTNKFMQPAIFPRLQAACISKYTTKEIRNQYLMFYQVAVFQLTHSLDFVIEHIGHVIKVTVINEEDTDISFEICENLRVTLEDALQTIVQLYGGTKVPYHKAIQCKTAIDLDDMITWEKLEECERVQCKAHQAPDDWHYISTTDFLGPWLRCQEKSRMVRRLVSKGNTASQGLEFVQLARLARRIPSSDLTNAANTSVSEVDWQHCRKNNKDNVVGEVYDMLLKWRSNVGSLTLKAVHEALLEAKSHISIEELREAVADTDTSEYLKGLSSDFLEALVNDEAIDLVSQNSPKTYRFLALELGMKNNVVDAVVQDVSSVIDRARHLLKMWRDMTPHSKSKEICRAMIEVEMDINVLDEFELLILRKLKKDGD